MQNVKLVQLANSTLGTQNLRAVTILPEGEDLNEWLAVNVVDFYNQISLLHKTVEFACLSSTCPIMNAGTKWEFHWCDGVEYKRPAKLSAPDYIFKLLTWTKAQIDDETLFPTAMGIGFSRKFFGVVKLIFKRLSRVYAHLFHCHYQLFVDAGIDTLLNTSFKHFIYFVKEFDLILPKDLLPLEQLIQDLA
jgi:MOB kinase activator 1